MHALEQLQRVDAHNIENLKLCYTSSNWHENCVVHFSGNCIFSMSSLNIPVGGSEINFKLC